MKVIERMMQITGLSEEECLDHELEPTWTYEKSGSEIWNTAGEFYYTKEDAIAEGKIFAEEEGLTEFEVGEKLEITMPGIDTDFVLERIAESVYDEVGEASETYLQDVKKEHQDELEEKLNEVLLDWATKYNYLPSCWKIVNVETIKL